MQVTLAGGHFTDGDHLRGLSLYREGGHFTGGGQCRGGGGAL